MSLTTRSGHGTALVITTVVVADDATVPELLKTLNPFERVGGITITVFHFTTRRWRW